MAHLTLLAGLVLPWITGTVWLIYIESFIGAKAGNNRLRQAGYGFFLGYAVLYAVILANATLADQVSYLAVMVSMAVLASAGGLLMYFEERQRPVKPVFSSLSKYSRAEKVLLLILVLWVGVHLVFAAVEILTIPVYPWDAWLVWVYRAKVWFYSGNVVELVSAREWIASSDPAIYAVHARAYPKFASIIPFWAAVSLGSWSETLVNLPVLLSGTAIGMALYGQCRSYGLGVLPALIFGYFLFSTPIFGAHLALAGYADIWMAGFAGLGFVAMMHGLIAEDRMHLALGLVMVSLSMLVKNEGVVWFYGALLLLFVATVRPRKALMVLGVITITAVTAAAFGVSYIEIPFIGGLGVVEDRISIPFVGTFSLEMHNVWREFLVNFFAMGSWNLAWVMVFTGLVLAAIPPFGKAKRVALLFMLIFIATQVFIFGFTDQGDWAAMYTAINRLPLQFLPALLFAVAVVSTSFLASPGNDDEAAHE